MKRIVGMLPHINIIISCMMITFFVIDRYNTAMAFINNNITKWLLLIVSILSIVNSIILICYQRKESK